MLLFALLRSPFPFVCKLLPLVGGALALVRHLLAFVREPLPLIRKVSAPSADGLSLIICGELSVYPRKVPAFSPPLAIEPRLSANAMLSLLLDRRSLTFIGGQFPDVGQPLALIGQPLAFIGQPLAFIGKALALIGDSVAFIRQVLAPVDCLLPPDDTLPSQVTLLAQVLAPQSESPSLRGKLFPLLSDLLTLCRYSLAFSRHPNELFRLVKRTARCASAAGDFPNWISVRTHLGPLSCH